MIQSVAFIVAQALALASYVALTVAFGLLAASPASAWFFDMVVTLSSACAATRIAVAMAVPFDPIVEGVLA